MKSGLGRAGGGERGETKSGNGTKNGKTTHVEISPREKCLSRLRNRLCRSSAGEGVAPNMG
jgi:hypothetical protein